MFMLASLSILRFWSFLNYTVVETVVSRWEWNKNTFQDIIKLWVFVYLSQEAK